MRYFFHIGYHGGNYHGWQRQTNAMTLQEIIEDRLEKIFKQKTTVYGCGRTDAGVHGSQYFFHINALRPTEFDLKFRLNKNLPKDIMVYDVLEMDDQQHARFDAISRSYDYYIHLHEDPFLRGLSTYIPEPLDLSEMARAAAIISHYTEFKSFCRRSHLFPDTSCQIEKSVLRINQDGTRLRFRITANRFLHGMIRIIMFYLIQIGKGTITFDDFKHMLDHQLEDQDKHLAPADGLYLSKVIYPYLKMDSKSSFAPLLNLGLEL